MKRILLSLLSIICTLGALNAQDIVNLRQDAKSQGLRYQVASVDEDVLVRKDYFREDWPQRKWFRDDLRNCLREESGNIYTFDRDGHMTKHTYTLRGSNIRNTICAYSNGQLVSLVGEGCKVVRHGIDLDIYSESSTYTSQALDNRKNDYAFDLKCRMEWADDGQLLASRYFFLDSTLSKSYEYSYNHRGQIASKVSRDYSIDPKHPSKVVTRYTYDNNDFLQKMTIRGENFDDTYTYENNEMGDPVKMTYTTSYSTTIYEYEYQYDASGNWTMRLQFKDGVFENATLRTIRYHSNGDAPSHQLATAQAAQKEAQQKAKADEAAMKQAQKEQQKKEKTEEKEKAKTEKVTKSEPKDKADKTDKKKSDKAEKASKNKADKADKASKVEKSSKADKESKHQAKEDKTKESSKKEKAQEKKDMKKKDSKADSKKSQNDKKSEVKKDKKEKSSAKKADGNNNKATSKTISKQKDKDSHVDNGKKVKAGKNKKVAPAKTEKQAKKKSKNSNAPEELR